MPKFTTDNAAEYGHRGGIARLKLAPERRQRMARFAAYRRWYKMTDSDVDRVDRSLKLLTSMVGMGMANDDWGMVIRALTAMVPYERMKIALNSNIFNVTPQIEDATAVEAKLAETRNRRNKALTSE